MKISTDMEKEKKNVQFADSMMERKYSLLGIVGVAQIYLSIDFVLDTKREMFGTKRSLNDLEVWELNQLITELRREYARRKKVHKWNNNKRKSV